MSRMERAAQFSPFAALTGYSDVIRETERFTEERVELDEGQKEMLNERLQMLYESASERQAVTITFFKPDAKKSGGTYETVVGAVARIDLYRHEIQMTSGERIPLDDIYSLEGNIFQGLS